MGLAKYYYTERMFGHPIPKRVHDFFDGITENKMKHTAKPSPTKKPKYKKKKSIVDQTVDDILGDIL